MYALNRFIAAGLMTIPAFKPRYMLAVYLGLCFVFGLAATLTRGHTSVAMLILVLCFESVRKLPSHYQSLSSRLTPNLML
jgi:FHS family L-fucose permease-like MFS transporter